MHRWTYLSNGIFILYMCVFLSDLWDTHLDQQQLVDIMNVKNLDVYIGWILGFIVTTLINWWFFPWFYDYFQELLRGF